MKDFLAVSTFRARKMFSGNRNLQTRFSPQGVRLAVCSLWLLLAGCAFGQTCTQTFTPANVGTSPYPGNNVNTAVQGGTTSTVLCFSSGAYGAIDLYNAHPTGVGQLTIKPSPGANVTGISFNLNGASKVLITGFCSPSYRTSHPYAGSCPSTGASSLDGGIILQVSGQGDNFSDSVTYDDMPTTGISQLSGNTGNYSGTNILIANNTFIGYASSGEADRMHIYGNACNDGIVVQNNEMANGESDGIQYGDCGLKILNNYIHDIHEGSCNGIHCDGIQDGGGGRNVTINGNWLSNNSDCFLLDDGSTNTTITNNVCSTDGQDNFWMQFGGAQTITLDHNTIISTSGAQYGDDHNSNPSSNITFTNNILYSVPSQNTGQPPSGTTTINFNLCPTSGCTGANSINGSTPTFVGGTSPTTYNGFVLTSGSAGHNAASNGKDIGINTTTVSATPNPPTNLTVSTQ